MTYCASTFCNNNKEGICTLEIINLVHRMTGGGLVLMCQEDTDNEN